MYENLMFKIITVILVAFFTYYGMDVRRKQGARHFVSTGWLRLMKFCSFALIGVFLGFAMYAREVSAIDWVSLVLLTIGTTFVSAAKITLGKAHTFTGQYLEKPLLVTRGVYSFTRNPLYFGVFQCELGATVFVLHQAPMLLPESYPYLIAALTLALLYAVLFNLKMAVRESQYLGQYFGDAYRHYSADVPFLVPFTKFRKEYK